MIYDKNAIIISKEGQPFELSYKICYQSMMLKTIIDANNLETSNLDTDIPDTSIEIPLDNINTSVLERIVFYMIYHNEVVDTEQWDNQFMKKFTGDELIDLVWAANHLQINGLLKLSIKHFTNIIDYNEPSDIRNILNISYDFTKEEEEIITTNYKWFNV